MMALDVVGFDMYACSNPSTGAASHRGGKTTGQQVRRFNFGDVVSADSRASFVRICLAAKRPDLVEKRP